MHALSRTNLAQSRIAQMLLAFLCVGVPFVLSNVAVKFFPAGAEMAPLRNGFKTLILIAAYLAYVRWIEKRSPSELSLTGALKETGFGFLLGAAVISASVAVLAACGAYSVLNSNIDVTWFRYLTGFLAVAILEELIFRVFLFRIVEKYFGSVIAIVLSIALFGIAHLANPNATWMSTASLAITSLILVGGFLLTRRLWFCLGIHWSWNLLQAFFSLPVSGNETRGLFNGRVTGPAWLTGGDFGIEVSAPTLILSVMTASALLYYAHKKGRFAFGYSSAQANPQTTVR